MIGIIPDQIVTESLVEDPTVVDGEVVADPERDLAKIAVVERHLGTGRMSVGLVRGTGLQTGALAQTVAHDAHNIVVVGMNDHDMSRAVTRLSEIGGGVVVVEDGGVRAELPLPVAGLLSDAPLDEVVAASKNCVEAAHTRLHAAVAVPVARLPGAVRDPGAEDHRPRAGRRRRLRARHPARGLMLLANAWVATMDDAGSEYRDGWVLVEDGLVSAWAAGSRRPASGWTSAVRSSRRASSTRTTTCTRPSRERARRRPTSSPG